jgi:hypothetical protein
MGCGMHKKQKIQEFLKSEVPLDEKHGFGGIVNTVAKNNQEIQRYLSRDYKHFSGNPTVQDLLVVAAAKIYQLQTAELPDWRTFFGEEVITLDGLDELLAHDDDDPLPTEILQTLRKMRHGLPALLNMLDNLEKDDVMAIIQKRDFEGFAEQLDLEMNRCGAERALLRSKYVKDTTGSIRQEYVDNVAGGIITAVLSMVGNNAARLEYQQLKGVVGRVLEDKKRDGVVIPDSGTRRIVDAIHQYFMNSVILVDLDRERVLRKHVVDVVSEACPSVPDHEIGRIESRIFTRIQQYKDMSGFYKIAFEKTQELGKIIGVIPDIGQGRL